MEPLASPRFAAECPERAVLVEFDVGKLPFDALDAVGLHLASCAVCQDVLSSLHGASSADALVAGLRESLRSPGLPVEPGWSLLAARAEQVGDRFALIENRGGDAAAQPGAEMAVEGSIGPYELLGKLGQGGMGVVYRARQVSLDRVVALKMILAGHHAGSQAVARFVLEGKAVARLRHPNVVQVYELGEFQGLPYYTMELVEGGNLLARLADGPFDLREAAILMRTLAAAVDYAHGEGVVHRDLKPANILLARDGTPRITDFGLAKLLDSDSEATLPPALTDSGAILGTVNYMAPEQLGGPSSAIGPATDVYALGAIFYELITGRPPLAAATKIETLQLVRSTVPAPPSRHRPGIPFWLEAICLKCLEKAPARRYASAQALAEDLDRWLRHERPQGTPGWLRRAGRAARRNSVALLAVLTLAALGVGWRLNDPLRAARVAEDTLARGQAVTMIGPTGAPRWSRWQAGESRSETSLADDGTFTLTTFTTALLDLVDDPQTPRYRLTAQVRHERSDPAGGVGLYAARVVYPKDRRKIHFFTLLSFNGVRTLVDIRPQLPFDFKRPPPRPPNPVRLGARLFSDPAVAPGVEYVFSDLVGVRFQPEASNPKWHDLELIVTPDRITASWDGQTFSRTTAEREKLVENVLKTDPGSTMARYVRELGPTYVPRGGLGLYVQRGSASFRAVRVTPL